MKIFKTLTIILSAVLMLSGCGDGNMVPVINTAPVSPAISANPSATASPTPSVTPSPTPSPTVSPTPTPTPDPIGDRISRMSDRELIGQMVMIGFDGTYDMDAKSIKLMQEYHIGSIFLFGWNIETFSQTSRLIGKINSHNKDDIPLLIGVDEEGGKVSRFKGGQWKPRLLSAGKLGALNDPQKVYDQYLQIGKKLKSVGFNIVFSPVIEIAHKPSSTFMGNRLFGSDPEKVSALIGKAIQGLHDAGMPSLGKHFPGHGDIRSDPHLKLAVSKATPGEMNDYYLKPFQSAVNDGIDAMMVAHITYPNIDKDIATVSPYFLTDVLRKQMGFKGVVVSDSLHMGGFRKLYTPGEGAVLYVLAGGDIVLFSKDYNSQKEVCESLYQALQSGRITRERLEESVRRILELKQKYCGLVP